MAREPAGVLAHLVHMDKRWIMLPGAKRAGASIGFAPNREEEAMILEILRAEVVRFRRRVLSGRGW